MVTMQQGIMHSCYGATPMIYGNPVKNWFNMVIIYVLYHAALQQGTSAITYVAVQHGTGPLVQQGSGSGAAVPQRGGNRYR
jgi:hypothetical protein